MKLIGGYWVEKNGKKVTNNLSMEKAVAAAVTIAEMEPEAEVYMNARIKVEAGRVRVLRFASGNIPAFPKEEADG